MSHTIIYNPETGFVESKMEGIIYFNEIKEIFSEVVQTLKEKEVFLHFADYREAKLSLSTMEIYGLPKMLSDTVAPLGLNVHKLKRAIVIAKDLEDYNFYETVSSNSWQMTKIFQDVDEAKKWLSEK